MSALGLDTNQKNYIVHPQKFALWLFILTVIMIFGGLTSAYIVQRSLLGEPQQLIFDLPSILWMNLVVIIFSSVPMQFSVWAAKKNDERMAILGLAMTFILGIVFLLGQVDAWGAMVDSGLPLVDPTRKDNSVSFFYIFTGLHGAHIVAALVVVLFALIRTGLKKFKPGRKGLTYEMTAIFWHFLGLLWVYLFIFLEFTQN